MRQFLVFQSLWAMQTEPGPLEAQLERIKAAGFDGITDHYFKPADVARLHAAATAQGLQIEGQLFPQSVDDLAAALDVISAYGCHHLTLQADVRPRTQAEAARLVEGWQRLAEQVDFPVLLETHRYRLTNDLLFTLDLLAQMPDLKLLADLSHYVVGRELPEPGAAEDDAQIRRILRNSWGFHGRVASSEQVQVSLDFPSINPGSGALPSGGATGSKTGWRARRRRRACPLPANSARRPMRSPVRTAARSAIAGPKR